MNVVILAAGQGKRMHSRLPKVLHPLAGRPMLLHVLDSARRLAPTRLAVVIGHGGEFQEAANRVAADFPETIFVVHNGTEFGGNIATLDFAYRREQLYFEILLDVRDALERR